MEYTPEFVSTDVLCIELEGSLVWDLPWGTNVVSTSKQ